MDNNFLEYRPKNANDREAKTVVEKTKNTDNVEDPLLQDFINHSPHKALMLSKEELDNLNDILNQTKDKMSEEDINVYTEAIDNHDISTVINKRKEKSEDIDASTMAEIFPFIYKIKKDLDENVKSFMLETFGEEINLSQAKKKTDAILNQITKKLSTINIDAIYMDTLYNFCLIDKSNIISEFLMDVIVLLVESDSKQYKTKELENVIKSSFKSLNVKNDKDAKKLEQFLFSDMYPSINNQMIRYKDETLSNLDVFGEIQELPIFARQSIEKTLNNSNNLFLNAVEDYLKANKTLEMLLIDYLESLKSKHELRKI